MTITPYLAMTAAEIQNTDPLPEKIAYMACHFSPYSTGISNVPASLPPGSMLILNDVTPICKHKPKDIADQICQCIQDNNCTSLLLDFQREPTEDMKAVTKAILEAAECPTAVTAPMAEVFSCPVFLPPCSPIQPLEAYLGQWHQHKIWIEVTTAPTVVTITHNGCQWIQGESKSEDSNVHQDSHLHCHYTIHPEKDSAVFTLWRTQQDLDDLLTQAESMGVTQAVGLYQQM